MGDVFVLRHKNRDYLLGNSPHFATVNWTLFLVGFTFLTFFTCLLLIPMFRALENPSILVWLFGIVFFDAFLLLVTVQQRHRHRRLRQAGCIIRGELTYFFYNWYSAEVSIKYCFTSPTTGKVIKGNTSTVARYADYQEGEANPPPGMMMAILYVDDHCYQVL
jgi:hypothetical protein